LRSILEVAFVTVVVLAVLLALLVFLLLKDEGLGRAQVFASIVQGRWGSFCNGESFGNLLRLYLWPRLDELGRFDLSRL
jgi:prolipoprotein diacylglyceryltransferase